MPAPRGNQYADPDPEPGTQGPRMSPCGKPFLLRSLTGMTWPESLADDEGAPTDLILSPAANMKRGKSNVSNLSSKSNSRTKENHGPRMQSWKRPQLLRSMSAMSGFSWTSGKTDKTGKSSHDNSNFSSGRPQLHRGASAISFGTWQSGASSGCRSTRGKKMMELEEELKANGERHISFSEERVVVYPQALNDRNSNQPNKIRTARFTLMTWLPKSLFQQFRRVANVYFLLICLLVNFHFSPKDWKSKVFPFMAVLIWTALKDLHEDRQRQRDDALENKQQCLLFNSHARSFEQHMWQDIFCGDLLLVRCDEAFPADMILLYAGGGQEAFISTISLDGETNLKERRPPSICDAIDISTASRPIGKQGPPGKESDEAEALRALSVLHMSELQARLGKPEVAVTDVKGSLSSAESPDQKCPLAWNNFLPRGCTLRNTSWVIGVVAYIGDETKTRLNTAKSEAKISNMQVYLNYCVWGLLTALVVVCLYSATLSSLQADEFSFCCDDQSWIIRLGIFLITFYHVLPMSLYVVFEMLKLLLGYQVNTDKQMVDPETGVSAMARTADLIEEMGQISFIFSDKTGTLTRNEMVFARCCIGGLDPGDFRNVGSEEKVESPEGVNMICKILNGEDGATGALICDVQWFFMCIAVCHNVQVQPVNSPEEFHVPSTSLGQELRQPKRRQTGPKNSKHANSEEKPFFGMSPDEVALVEAANQVGVVFHARTRNHLPGASTTSSCVTLSIEGNQDATKVFTVLHELEFTSDRKRMSVVCEHEGEYYCITKGADSAMESLITEKIDVKYTDCLKKFSQQGLRTLVIAMKKIDIKYFRAWEARYVSALACSDDTRDFQVAEIAEEMEQDLLIVGITAVEDRLQDGVPEAIEIVKTAGVRVWVLTGDKTETAVEIAKSCLLFNSETRLAYAVEADSLPGALQKLQVAKSILQDTAGENDGGLVLDGRTLQYALQDEACQDLIYELGLASRSCVCCRLTPLQKRQLVELVRTKNSSTVTLAIGDGANDVPMIEGAHLGIAVRGKEGCQAVQDQYRGRIAFPEYVSVNYNVLFTSWHILFVLGFDEDVPDDVAISTPSLYHVGPARALFNRRIFSLWMICGVYHGAVAWIIPNLWFGKSFYEKKLPGPFWVGSCASFTIIIFIVCLKLLLSSVSPLKLWTSILPSLAAILLYVIALGCLSYTSMGVALQPSMEGIPMDVLKSKEALISLFAVPPACLTVDVASKILKRILWPTPLDQVKKGWLHFS